MVTVPFTTIVPALALNVPAIVNNCEAFTVTVLFAVFVSVPRRVVAVVIV